MLFFFLFTAGFLRHSANQEQEAQQEEAGVLQLIALYSKGWREGVFTPKVQYPIKGKLPSEHSAEVWVRTVITTALLKLQQVMSIICLSEETNCRIFPNPSNTSVSDIAFISLGFKALPLFYLLAFSCITSFVQRNTSNTQLCRDKPLFFRRVCVLEVLALLEFFPCKMQSLFFSEEVLVLKPEFNICCAGDEQRKEHTGSSCLEAMLEILGREDKLHVYQWDPDPVWFVGVMLGLAIAAGDMNEPLPPVHNLGYKLSQRSPPSDRTAELKEAAELTPDQNISH